MSTISINTLSGERYAQEAEDFLLNAFDKYMFEKYFKVGGGIKDFNEVKHNVAIKKLVCNANCIITNYIKEQLTKPAVVEKYCPLPTKDTKYILTENSLILSSDNNDSLIY